MILTAAIHSDLVNCSVFSSFRLESLESSRLGPWQNQVISIRSCWCSSQASFRHSSQSNSETQMSPSFTVEMHPSESFHKAGSGDIRFPQLNLLRFKRIGILNPP